jgi:hypothetical protein
MALPPTKSIRFKLSVPEWQAARKAAIDTGERWFLRWVRKVVVKASTPSDEKKPIVPCGKTK